MNTDSRSLESDARLHAEPDRIRRHLGGNRLLLFGAMGTGKSTLATAIARHAADTATRAVCVSADPGSPAFGPPGAAALAEWGDDGWTTRCVAPLCTLDAARFRLPMLQAVRALLVAADAPLVLIDAPGVVRGVAGAELLGGLVDAAAIDAIVVLHRAREPIALADELVAMGVPWMRVEAAGEARRPPPAVRAERRTRQWDEWLGDTRLIDVSVTDVNPFGMPPPLHATAAWYGRQVAWRGRDGWVLGEIVAFRTGTLTIRTPAAADTDPTGPLLVRDARRGRDGQLATAPRHEPVAVPVPEAYPAAAPRRPALRAGALTATLVNGVFGDALVQVRVRHSRRALLLDLGDTHRLSLRELNAVTDVCLSHCHFDHVAGFLRLLRARLAATERPCRFYGPPGTAAHLASQVDGIHWDRIGDDAPVLDVAELHADALQWTRIRPGRAPRPLPPENVVDGVLAQIDGTTLRATTLDHSIPVLAYAVQLPQQLNVRNDGLRALGLTPGPWLGELKARVAAGERDRTIALPGGRRETLRTLRDALILEQPGITVAYATDLADTAQNRLRLVAHARGAELLFLEAPFRHADRGQALRTQHLTTRACGEIAAAAGVARLVPFHFSKRYDGDADAVYAEIAAACPHVRIER